ncbi:MAG: LCP family protein [Clostridia bacterium]|nr:LCP family protein [Clostridia bacterium]
MSNIKNWWKGIGKVSGSRRRKHGKRAKGMKPGTIVLISILSVLLVGIVAGIWWVTSYFDYDYNPITKDPDQLGVVEPPEEAKEITNIALFGIDSRDDDYKGLSDTIMVISINPNTGSIKLVSIMRDTLVEIDGHGYQKINAAYSKGGPELAIKTLNKTFRLNIMNYATVDFVGMAEIVDSVGGVQVELTKAEIPQINGCIDELANTRGLPRDYVSEPGVQTLNGVQAVAFSRVRKVPTVSGTRDDYGRTERQRLVMNQLFQKALQLPLAQYPSLIKAMLPYIETSMGFDDILSLAKILKAGSVTMQQDRIPIDGSVVSSGYYVPYIGACVYYDLEFAADLLNAFFFEDTSFDDYVAENGIRKNLWYTGPTGTGTKPSTDTQSTSTSTTTDQAQSSSGGTTDTTDTANASDSGTVTDTDASSPSTDSSSASDSSPNTQSAETQTSSDSEEPSDTGTSEDAGDSE